ncbi:hypothetical protein Q1695_003772 [Nippostrongylus brasiliensis]|nr:hypothetical protein Q1695_003772 [Nippostrongylus brasiliensis]
MTSQYRSGAQQTWASVLKVGSCRLLMEAQLATVLPRAPQCYINYTAAGSSAINDTQSSNEQLTFSTNSK